MEPFVKAGTFNRSLHAGPKSMLLFVVIAVVWLAPLVWLMRIASREIAAVRKVQVDLPPKLLRAHGIDPEPPEAPAREAPDEFPGDALRAAQSDKVPETAAAGRTRVAADWGREEDRDAILSAGERPRGSRRQG